ncbi:MAG: PHP domain-containing protein [Candidatus Micrarchaeota archaeon]
MAQKYDLHLHSSLSIDSLNKPEDLVKKYHGLGFSGFAITDHSKFGAHKKAREYALAHDLKIEIIPACEFYTDKGEVIGLYLQEMINEKNFESLCDEIHDQGGFVVLPHPFDSYRKGAMHPERHPKALLRFIDAIESINGHCLLNSDNEKAREFAQNHGFAQTGGSDAHLLGECASAYTQIPDNLSLELALRKNKTLPCGKTIPFYTRGIPTLIKLAKKSGFIR